MSNNTTIATTVAVIRLGMTPIELKKVLKGLFSGHSPQLDGEEGIEYTLEKAQLQGFDNNVDFLIQETLTCNAINGFDTNLANVVIDILNAIRSGIIDIDNDFNDSLLTLKSNDGILAIAFTSNT